MNNIIPQNIITTMLDNLRKRYPDQLPTKLISEYELGKLIGTQEVIKYLENYIQKVNK